MSNIAPSAEDTERAVDKEWHEYTRECMKFCEWPAHTESCLEIREALLATARAEGREARPDDLRADGWSVAVHNDYRQGGASHTFWLLTKDGQAVKGEGPSDAAALNEVRAAILAIGSPPLSLPPPAAEPVRAGDVTRRIPVCADDRLGCTVPGCPAVADDSWCPGCGTARCRTHADVEFDHEYVCAAATVAELRAEVARLTPESQVGRRCALEQHGDRIERGTADNARLVRELREARAEVVRKDAALWEARRELENHDKCTMNHRVYEAICAIAAALASPSATKEEA